MIFNLNCVICGVYILSYYIISYYILLLLCNVHTKQLTMNEIDEMGNMKMY